ncbi:MAG: hypothetical protein WC422_05330 [Candidatus Paceibacterota bacterium]|jgi:hypothetical protein
MLNFRKFKELVLLYIDQPDRFVVNRLLCADNFVKDYQKIKEEVIRLTPDCFKDSVEALLKEAYEIASQSEIFLPDRM